MLLTRRNTCTSRKIDHIRLLEEVCDKALEVDQTEHSALLNDEQHDDQM